MRPVKSKAFCPPQAKKNEGKWTKMTPMKGFLASRIGMRYLGGGSTSGQPQTSDLEGGAGTPLQVWLARPETWRGV